MRLTGQLGSERVHNFIGHVCGRGVLASDVKGVVGYGLRPAFSDRSGDMDVEQLGSNGLESGLCGVARGRQLDRDVARQLSKAWIGSRGLEVVIESGLAQEVQSPPILQAVEHGELVKGLLRSPSKLQRTGQVVAGIEMARPRAKR